MQNSLNELVGLTPDGRAIYSNVGISLAGGGSKLVDRFGRTIIDFETQEMNLFGHSFTMDKLANLKYLSSPPFLMMNEKEHDLVEYNRNERYANVLWLDEISVQSMNSGVKVEVEIIEIDPEDENEGITVSLIGALEDISQFDITEKDAKVSITPKKSWGYVASRETDKNVHFDNKYHSIVGKIPIEELTKRKVKLTIKVPKGAVQYLWDKNGLRKRFN